MIAIKSKEMIVTEEDKVKGETGEEKTMSFSLCLSVSGSL